MKILLMSVGTRGDIEPFLAIGEFLSQKGEDIICAFPEQFRNLVEDSNIKFVSLGTKFIEMLESDDGKAAMGENSSGLKKIIAYIKLARNQTEANKELVNLQYEIVKKENPDRIVYNGKSIYPIIWELNNSGKTIFVSPIPYMHYVKGHTHVAFNSNFGNFFNRLTFSLAHFGMVTTVLITKKWLEISEKIDRKEVRNILKFNKSIYTISPSLFQPPSYWNENLKVLGYYERYKKENWIPGKELLDFIEKHKKILFITFGSMLNPNPDKKTKLFLEILEQNKISAIINTASGGLVKPDGFNSEFIQFVSEIPYNWILPKIYAVIHHGGSGTTHLALKNGCASMIIPHIIDQFVWNKILTNIGVGPKGISVGNLNSKNLEPRIIDLMSNRNYKEKAEIIGIEMKAEDFKDELYNAIIK